MAERHALPTEQSLSHAEKLYQIARSFTAWGAGTGVDEMLVLLAIALVSQRSEGYPWVPQAEVRRLTDLKPYQFTRCLRVLEGKQRSVPLSAGRPPLVAVAPSDENRALSMLSLTAMGQQIVDAMRSPLTEEAERIRLLERRVADLEGKLGDSRRENNDLEDGVRIMGMDPAKLRATQGFNGMWWSQAGHVLAALVEDATATNREPSLDGWPNLQRQLACFPPEGGRFSFFLLQELFGQSARARADEGQREDAVRREVQANRPTGSTE